MSKTASRLTTYVATLVSFIVLDAVWLTLVGIGQFQAQIGAIMRAQPNFWAAGAFYLTYAGGLVALAVVPAIAARSATAAATSGAIVGLTAYATFDLTCLAIIKGWTVGLALLDMTWGTFASAVAARIGYAAGLKVTPSRLERLPPDLDQLRRANVVDPQGAL